MSAVNSANETAYLSRYTHRVAIGNSRLVAFDGNTVSFKRKDCLALGHERYKIMTLSADEFVRRFLIHNLPDGFHRIRHYGLFANGGRVRNMARASELLGVVAPETEPADANDGEERRSLGPVPVAAVA